MDDPKAKNFDPANPENKPITDGMVDDGELLRDIQDGKSPTEQAFGIDLGSDGAAIAEADAAMFDEIGKVIAAEEEATAPPPADETPIEFVSFIPADGSAPSPLAAMADADADLMDELGEIVKRDKPQPPPRSVHGLTPQRNVRQAAFDRGNERKARLGLPPREVAKMQAEDGAKFAELHDVMEAAEPDAPDAPLAPDALARIKHPGKEKPGEFGEAFAEFAHEDKAWRADATDMFRLMAHEIRQLRWDLDEIRGFLERSRL